MLPWYSLVCLGGVLLKLEVKKKWTHLVTHIMCLYVHQRSVYQNAIASQRDRIYRHACVHGSSFGSAACIWERSGEKAARGASQCRHAGRK